MSYAIETLHAGTWTTDGLGDEVLFDTREVAEEALTSLLKGASASVKHADCK